jgi:membrane protein insertase Oxa1/YidC/SpoIIIJ
VALGVYMLTNSILGIVQQLVLEQVAPRGKPPGEITVKQTGEKKKLDGGFGKEKARV